MKKALPETDEVFIAEKEGKITVWDFFAEEIVEAINANADPHHPVFIHLRKWMSRYLDEGVTDKLLDDLNSAIHDIRYAKYILPSDLIPSETGLPRNGYVAQYDEIPNPEAYAADDFSKLLTSGQLKRLKRCQMDDCDKFFLGPPQARWCSKTCGSKFRVREKRKRDAQ